MASAGITGYEHPSYANSLTEFGSPIALPASGGWLLKRPVSDGYDAMGPYPLFCCADWEALPRDLDVLRDELASVVLVADPFGAHGEQMLQSCFDRVMPFKSHFVVDLDRKGPIGTKHHHYYASRALREVAIEVSNSPGPMLAEWIALYGNLTQRHAITGIQAFSPESFQRQFAVPGLTYFRAITGDGECVGAHLWFVQGDVAYSHLAAASQRGYELSCSYALYSAAIQAFQGKVRWLDLGGAAGCHANSGGLTKFKQGWANTLRTAFLCGSILNPGRYEELTAKSGAQNAEYFPAYRWRDAG